MSNSAFRIETVSVEGFKAFTKKQTFRFSGRHVFLFGPNGYGKTSIVEAIRWCLFGLASRQEDIVKNQFYSGPCVVELALSGPDGLWTMERRLRPSGGAGRLTIRDPNGIERNLEDVFPQLSRIGPREGTHVIYAAQQPPNRRPEANITDFSYVVYRYLGLEEVPRLSDRLLTLSKDWKEQEDEICQSVEALGETLSQRIAGVDIMLDRITSDPPWTSILTPTTSDTRDRIDQLTTDAEQIGAPCSSEALRGLTPHDKLYEVGTAINSFLAGELTDLTQRLAGRANQLQNARSQLENGQLVASRIEEQSKTRQVFRKNLDSVLNGSPIEDLEKELESTQASLKSSELRLDLVRASLKYLDATTHAMPHDVCPICEHDVQIGELKFQLQGSETSGDYETSEILEHRDRLRERISRARQLSRQIDDIDTETAQNESTLAQTLEQAGQTLDIPSPSSLEFLSKYIDDSQISHQELQDTLTSKGQALQAWESRLENARREIRFHELRGLKERLQRLNDVRYQALHDDLKDLGDLRNIADDTRNLLNSRLRERLSNDLPPIAKEMTEVYLRLTGSPTFDSIHINQENKPDGSMDLALRVSSSRGPGAWELEDGILNGQALNAIQLVPYFVFSRYQVGPLLDLLLLDDPTQTFDTIKINLLLTELASAASHATLFLATHEEDKFLPVLKNFFHPDDVKAYKAIGLDEEGPHFEDVTIPL